MFKPELRPSFINLVMSLSKFLEDVAGYMDFSSISTLDGFKDAELKTNPVIFINEMILDED